MSHYKHQSPGCTQTFPGPHINNATKKQPEALAQDNPAGQGTKEWLLPGVSQSWAHPSSSEPSAQSFSPSHTYSWATHSVPSRQSACVRGQNRWGTGVRGCAGLDRSGGVGGPIRAELVGLCVVVVVRRAVVFVGRDRVVAVLVVADRAVVVLVGVARAVVGAGVVLADVDWMVVDVVVALLVGAGVVVSAVVVLLGVGLMVEVVEVVGRAAAMLVVVLVVVVTGGGSGRADPLLAGTGRGTRTGVWIWGCALPTL